MGLTTMIHLLCDPQVNVNVTVLDSTIQRDCPVDPVRIGKKCQISNPNPYPLSIHVTPTGKKHRLQPGDMMVVELYNVGGIIIQQYQSKIRNDKSKCKSSSKRSHRRKK